MPMFSKIIHAFSLILLVLCISSACQDPLTRIEAPSESTPVKKKDQKPSGEPSHVERSHPQDKALSVISATDFIRVSNEILKTRKQKPLTHEEELEIDKLVQQWNTPLLISIGLYLVILTLIVSHTLRHKHYKWTIAMLLLTLLIPTLAWICPILYTRRYILREQWTQQLPIILIQLLPVGLWWLALSDIATWMQRVFQVRSITP